MANKKHGTPAEALNRLRRTLTDGQAQAGLNTTQLAGRAGVSRTTAWAALRSDGPVPSAATVAALGRALRLPVQEILTLRRTAAGESDATRTAPGRLIGEWNPHALEVHPASTAPGAGDRREPVLPGYVGRAHDRVLAEVIGKASEGLSQMLVLVGTSSTGKTRACWEAVQPLAAEAWRLWHPFDPTRADAALETLDRVAPRTVLWLNEAQHYLGDSQAGERVAAALHTLLTDPGRAPVLILGTLWPEYADEYAKLPVYGSPDRHSRARELLAGRTLPVPDTFDEKALVAAGTLAEGGDGLLAGALARARAHGRIAQDLAGAPELMRRYENGTPAVRALLNAAMDARRLGVGLHLPQAFLTDAAIDYLDDHDYGQLTEDWAEAAYADLARHVHGKQSPLSRASTRPARRTPGMPAPVPSPTGGPMLRLADYLEQHGRTTRRRLCPPASFWDAAHSHLTRPEDLSALSHAAEVRCRLQWAHHLQQRAADAGDVETLLVMARTRSQAGLWEAAEELYQKAADGGSGEAMTQLARVLDARGDRAAAEELCRQAVTAGSEDALATLASDRENGGDRAAAEELYQEAADAGSVKAMIGLIHLRREAGNREADFDADELEALVRVSMMSKRVDDREELAGLLDEEGFLKGFLGLTFMLLENDDPEAAEAYLRKAVDAGDTDALFFMAERREEEGDQETAEELYQQIYEEGDASGLESLAQRRERAGDEAGAADLARLAADAGALSSLALRFWPDGLDPDGSPTPPWKRGGATSRW
ncbi:hypothetical protein OHA91_39310 (plasmid) [Streptomyces erythrochromogenes]|uniref:HTH cro/C1-type domain-containing protein n=1 Tax=Streptomyces erythrochromogenes TaxID=285574 RepID=A0ABZ1QQH5_9ACTN|nr:hypothetical protein [Streptomyces erythrochromogenes]